MSLSTWLAQRRLLTPADECKKWHASAACCGKSKLGLGHSGLQSSPLARSQSRPACLSMQSSPHGCLQPSSCTISRLISAGSAAGVRWKSSADALHSRRVGRRAAAGTAAGVRPAP